MSSIKEKRTLYIRNPKNNYAFEKIGTIGSWMRSYKSIRIQGKLYRLIEEVFEE